MLPLSHIDSTGSSLLREVRTVEMRKTSKRHIQIQGRSYLESVESIVALSDELYFVRRVMELLA